MSVVSAGSWMNGTNDAPMPTSISSSGAENRIRSAIAVTATTAAAMARMLRAMSTGSCCHPRDSVAVSSGIGGQRDLGPS